MKRTTIALLAGGIIGLAVLAATAQAARPGAQDRAVRAGTQDELAMLAGFTVTVARTPTGMSLACEQGCGWKTLQLSAAKSTPVNENGIANAKTNPENKSRFLIRFAIEDTEFSLTCAKGCAWTSLAFPVVGKPIAINEYGMARPEKK